MGITHKYERPTLKVIIVCQSTFLTLLYHHFHPTLSSAPTSTRLQKRRV